MSTKPPKPKGKTEVVATRLGHAEIAQMDAIRGHLTRAQWIRWVVLRALREQKGS